MPSAYPGQYNEGTAERRLFKGQKGATQILDPDTFIRKPQVRCIASTRCRMANWLWRSTQTYRRRKKMSNLPQKTQDRQLNARTLLYSHCGWILQLRRTENKLLVFGQRFFWQRPEHFHWCSCCALVPEASAGSSVLLKKQQPQHLHLWKVIKLLNLILMEHGIPWYVLRTRCS